MPKSRQPKYNHSDTLEALDGYMSALFAVLAFTNEVRWDPSSRELKKTVQYEFGRRMTTSNANRVSPSTSVTPDCVVQSSPLQGYVTEAKIGLPKNEAYWDGDVLQLTKYDDDLTGWWTDNELISTHEIVALVPLLRAVRFAEIVKEGEAADRWQFHKNLTILGFERQIGPEKTWLILKKEGGEITPPELGAKLRYGVKVRVELLVEVYDDRRFLDHAPPLPFLLQVLWDDLFTQYASAAGFDGSSLMLFDVTVPKVTADLQKFYGFASAGARSPEIPRRAWIKEALDAMVDFNMADAKDNSVYAIRYRRQRGDMLERFGRLCHQRQRKPKLLTADKQSMLGFPDTEKT